VQTPPKLPQIPGNIPTVPIPDAKPKKVMGRFSHTSPGDHASFGNPGNCSSCHNRAGLTGGTLPGHRSCDKCHNFPELTQTSAPSFCGICHTNGDKGAVKTVRNIRSFNSLFNHQSHRNNNCAVCHKPQGAKQSIPPSNVNVHAQCYTCHTAGSKIGSCGECHRSGRPGGWNASTASPAYGRAFSHVTHGGRQRLDCNDCHTITRTGRSDDITSIDTEQHFPKGGQKNCVSCHNDKPTFGEKDFGDCKKCHTGRTFG
jgi:c(7)-type cytochrome triheme protein